MSDKLKVSHSGMQTYRKCPFKYKLGRVLGVEPVGVKRAPNFGSAGHTELERMAGGTPGYKDYQLGGEDDILLECLILGYKTLYGGLEGKAEGKFCVPIIGPDGKPDPGVELRGMIDIETDAYIMDHKFTSRNITDTYIKELHRTPQAEEYLIAAQENGSEATYAIWDIIRSTRYKRRLCTPESEREYYKTSRKDKYTKGDPKPGTYLSDESWEEFRQRIVDDIAADPDKFYQRVELHKTEEELDARRYDIWACAKQIEHSTAIDAFPRNEAGCNDFGGCEYAPICWEGVQPEQSELYTIGKRKGQ